MYLQMFAGLPYINWLRLYQPVLKKFIETAKTFRKSRYHVSLVNRNVDVDEIVDDVLNIIYNQPIHEETPGDNCYALLFSRIGKNKKCATIKALPPMKL